MPRTVLIVDDSPTIRAFARIFLKQLGVEIVEADDGKKALEAVHTSKPDLCVVDVDMPVMDGLAFTRDLRKDADPALAGLPVILLTGDRTKETKDKGLAAGANDLLEKPVKGPELQAMVKKHLGSAA